MKEPKDQFSLSRDILLHSATRSLENSRSLLLESAVASINQANLQNLLLYNSNVDLLSNTLTSTAVDLAKTLQPTYLESIARILQDQEKVHVSFLKSAFDMSTVDRVLNPLLENSVYCSDLLKNSLSIHHHFYEQVYTSYRSYFPNSKNNYEVSLSELEQKTGLDWSAIAEDSVETVGNAAIFQLKEVSEADTIEQQISTFETIHMEAVLAGSGTDIDSHVVNAYRFINILERNLRSFIVAVLHDVDPNWMKTLIPGNFKKLWKERQEDEVKKGFPPKDLIQYADFGDYASLVVNGNCWPHFEKYFGNKDAVKGTLFKLGPYRNMVAHTRNLDKSDLVIVAGDCEWFLKRMGQSLFK